LALAYSGFFLNLINLLPMSPLDGGRITAILSPRIWFLGVPVLLGLMLYQPSPMLFIIALLALPQLRKVWRGEAPSPGYYEVAAETRVEYGIMYLGLTALLALMTYRLHLELPTSIAKAFSKERFRPVIFHAPPRARKEQTGNEDRMAHRAFYDARASLQKARKRKQGSTSF
jgi:hypothetical protein